MEPGAVFLCERRVFLAGEVAAHGPGLVCLTGSGGKTTLLYALGAALADRGARVLCTTSTRLCRPRPEQSPHFLSCPTAGEIPVLEKAGMLTAARPAAEGHDPAYLRGYSREDLDRLLERGAADWILVEADGAGRRPLKAPAEKEPVIPGSTRVVIAVVGLSGLGKPFTDTWVFRPGLFADLTGLPFGRPITARAVAKVLAHPDGLCKGAPTGAMRLAFLNQADLPGGREAGRAIARELCALEGRPHAVYLGSARPPDLACVKLEAAQSQNRANAELNPDLHY